MGKLEDLPIVTKHGWPWDEEVDPIIYLESKVDWPKISIVTPSFMQGQFLEETIRSVVLQNYPNIEYIIIDGGSYDKSAEIIDKYSEWINYWVSEKDNGQADAIIKGFSKSTGKIMNWLNSDDIFEKNAFYIIGKTFNKDSSIDFVHGRNGIMDINSQLYSYMPHPSDNLPSRYIYEMPYGQQACFFTKEIYVKSGGINSKLQFSLDYELYLKIHLQGAKSIQIDELIGSIRIHNNTKTSQLESIMHKENGNAFMTFLTSIGEVKKAKFLRSIGHISYSNYFIQKQLSDKSINQIWLGYLMKNVWYYYNLNQFSISGKMAFRIIINKPIEVFNLNYLKLIKDWLLKWK